MLSCEISEIFENIYFEEYLRRTASVTNIFLIHLKLMIHFTSMLPSIPEAAIVGVLDFSWNSALLKKSTFWNMEEAIQRCS